MEAICSGLADGRLASPEKFAHVRASSASSQIPMQMPRNKHAISPKITEVRRTLNGRS
jgi:hypothetical protein